MDERLQNYFQGLLDSSEKLKLLQEVNTDESLKEKYQKTQNLHALADLITQSGDRAVGEQSYRRFAKQVQYIKVGHMMFRLLSYAAIVTILFASSWWLSYRYYQEPSSMNTLFVPAGQRARLTLQDGTEVWLNARSTLTYPARFSGEKREVSLVGEGFFVVAKEASKPFIVSTKESQIRVLGTKFNVKSYAEMGCTFTSLLEGSVEVSNRVSGAKSLILQPNQQVLISKEKMEVDPIRHFSYFLWKDGVYSFEKEKFESIIKQLELYFDVKIIADDPEILNFVYTGKVRQQDGIDEILRVIQKIQHFEISKDKDHNMITLSK